ncbi:MAG: hypothetical protein M5U28_49400 [Sandaracinaceae bacterium]|nr:hypothetical protein [Sandaracinaceae bacterium]
MQINREEGDTPQLRRTLIDVYNRIPEEWPPEAPGASRSQILAAMMHTYDPGLLDFLHGIAADRQGLPDFRVVAARSYSFLAAGADVARMRAIISAEPEGGEIRQMFEQMNPRPRGRAGVRRRRAVLRAQAVGRERHGRAQGGLHDRPLRARQWAGPGGAHRAGRPLRRRGPRRRAVRDRLGRDERERRGSRGDRAPSQRGGGTIELEPDPGARGGRPRAVDGSRKHRRVSVCGRGPRQGKVL